MIIIILIYVVAYCEDLIMEIVCLCFVSTSMCARSLKVTAGVPLPNNCATHLSTFISIDDNTLGNF